MRTRKRTTPIRHVFTASAAHTTTSATEQEFRRAIPISGQVEGVPYAGDFKEGNRSQRKKIENVPAKISFF